MDTITKIPEVNILDTTRSSQCGKLDGVLKFPMFLRGECGGEDNCVILIASFAIPDRLDKRFFEEIAVLIKNHSFYDWDWGSFARNVVYPNLKHIQLVMQLGDIASERLGALFVVLDDWFPRDDGDEHGSDYISINHETFFTEAILEY